MATVAQWGFLWHITLVYELHGQSCQNGFYISNRIAIPDYEPTVGPYPQYVFGQFYSYVYPEIRDFSNQQVHYLGIIVQTLIPHNGPVYEFVIESETGAQADESLPGYCSAILSVRTGFGGKSNRGRLYFSGVAEDDHAAGKLLPSAFTQLTSIGNQLLSIFGPTGSSGFLGHVIFSKKLGYSGGVYSSAGIRQVTHYVPRLVLGTQRHRLIGIGT